jgi:hypothetical protein
MGIPGQPELRGFLSDPAYGIPGQPDLRSFSGRLNRGRRLLPLPEPRPHLRHRFFDDSRLFAEAAQPH